MGARVRTHFPPNVAPFPTGALEIPMFVDMRKFDRSILEVQQTKKKGRKYWKVPFTLKLRLEDRAIRLIVQSPLATFSKYMTEMSATENTNPVIGSLMERASKVPACHTSSFLRHEIDRNGNREKGPITDYMASLIESDRSLRERDSASIMFMNSTGPSHEQEHASWTTVGLSTPTAKALGKRKQASMTDDGTIRSHLNYVDRLAE